MKYKSKIIITFSVLALVVSLLDFNYVFAVPSVTVSVPNGGECWQIGTSRSIQWTMNPEVHHVEVYYSPTGMAADRVSIVHAAPSQISYSWFVSVGESTSSKIFIDGHNDHGATSPIVLAADASDNHFAVLTSCIEPSPSPTASPTPAPGPGPADTFPPVVTGFGVGQKVDGRNVIGITFNEGIQSATITSSSVFIFRTDIPVLHLDAILEIFPTAFNLVTNVGLSSNVNYTVAVLRGVRDFAGNQMSADYFCSFTWTGSVITSCPSGPVTSPTPLPTPSPSPSPSPTPSPSPSPFPSPSPMPVADAFVEGVVTDVAEQPVANAGVHVFKEDFSLNFGTTTAANGSYRLPIPAGTYLIEIFSPMARNDLLKPAPQSFTVALGETKVLNLRFAALTKTITGRVVFSNGNPVADAEVGAYNQASSQWTSSFTDANGSYNLKVGPGTWNVGIRPRNPMLANWNWSEPFQQVTFLADASAETKSVNFTVTTADAKVTVRVTDQDGKSIPNAGVVLDTVSGGVYDPTKPRLPPEFRKSDSAGLATFLVPPSTYYLRAFLPPELGLINPEEKQVDAVAGQDVAVTLTFRKPDATTSATITGTAKLDDGKLVDAFVWAWSEKGGFSQTRAATSGAFSLAVNLGDRWHIGAGKEVNGFPYKSSEITVEVATPSVSVELVLVKISNVPLPPRVSVSQTATQQAIVQTQDGAKVIVPGGAALQGGTVNVEIKPTIEAPSQAATEVVSTVYDVTIRDQAGQAITQLQQEVEITIPYNEEDLKAQGVTEDAVRPSSFDETTGTWVKVDNYTIDKEKNIVIVRVKHLTRFALVAAADTLPPAAPTNVIAKRAGSGKVLISWTNPLTDFRHAKIYRSTQSGVLGSAVFAEVRTSSQQDSGLTNGLTYYYTVRSVDPAGNESTNTNQVAITPSTETEAIAQEGYLFAKDLVFGMENDDDVRNLQQFLTDLGIYKGPITGNFFNLTRQAIILFQQQNGIPAVGRVGPLTRAKLNELSGARPTPPPGGPFRFLKDLIFGMTNDPDVRALQELLTKLGLYDGPITGNFLNLTQATVKRFQEVYGIPAVGRVGPLTRTKLNELSK